MKGKALLMSSAAVALVGCGGGSGGDQPAGPNTVSESDVIKSLSRSAFFYSAVQSSVPAGIGAPLPSLPFQLPVADQVSCSTFNISGDDTDADNDGIPVNLQSTFNCTYQPNQNITITYDGQVHVKDDNDSDPQSGWDICTGTINGNCSRNPVRITHSSPAGTIDLDLTGDMDLDGDPNVGYTFTTYFSEYKWTVNNSQVTIQIDASGTTFDPDNTDGDNDPWNRGTLNGTMTVTAIDDQGNTTSMQIDITNLQIGYCPDGGAKSGSIQITWDCPQGSAVSQATLNVTIISCNNASWALTDCDGNTISFP